MGRQGREDFRFTSGGENGRAAYAPRRMHRCIRIRRDRQIGCDAHSALDFRSDLLRCAKDSLEAPDIEHHSIRRGFLNERREVPGACHQHREISGSIQTRKHAITARW
jgi:hypothetical protein